MAIILDDQMRAAIVRRRARGRDATLLLRVEAIPARGGVPHFVAVTWAPRRWPRRTFVERQVEGVAVCMDQRLARYTRWRDVTISAWRLGPLEHLVVEEELLVLLEMEEWERTHPSVA